MRDKLKAIFTELNNKYGYGDVIGLDFKPKQVRVEGFHKVRTFKWRIRGNTVYFRGHQRKVVW